MKEVSVIIDTYNNAEFIEEAIESTLNQTFPLRAMEIIVIDDGSTDNTEEIVKRFKDVKYIKKKNKGQGSCFNLAFSIAEGKYLMFLDGDDYWTENHVERVYDFFENNPDIDLVGSHIYRCYQDTGIEEYIGFPQIEHFMVNTMDDARFYHDIKSAFGTSRLNIRRSIWQKEYLIPECIWIQADMYLVGLLALRHKMAIIPEPLTFYRIHGENLFMISSRKKLLNLFRVEKVRYLMMTKRLSSWGYEEVFIKEYLFPDYLALKKLYLSNHGVSPVETIGYILEELKYHRSHWSTGFKFFKMFTVIPGTFLPPVVFMEIKKIYRNSFLYRLRKSKIKEER